MLGCLSIEDVPKVVNVAVEFSASSGSAGKVRSWKELRRAPLSGLVWGEEIGETSIMTLIHKQIFACETMRMKTIGEFATPKFARNTTRSCTSCSAA